MRIAFHAMLIHPRRAGGAETYARNLVAALQNVDSDNAYDILVPADSDLRLQAPNFRRIDCDVPALHPIRRVLWEQIRLPAILESLKPDVVHFPGSTAPFPFLGPAVVTLHDTLRYQLPGVGSRLLNAYYDANQRWLARSRKRIIAVSHADAAVMRRRLGVPASRLEVVPLGVDERFFGRPIVVRQERGELLYLGRGYPHKNLQTLIDAIVLLHRRGRTVRLRCIGLSGTEVNNVERHARSQSVESSVRCTAPMHGEELLDALRHAALLCLPSRVESFGLPILEALATGTPVVASDLPAFRELYGDRFVSCPPDSAESFATAIDELLDDRDRWTQLAEGGREHARRFTWEACANATLRIYERAAADAGT
jgi:glycosyltransferase involved in cell wall biosynthesis